MSQSLETHAKTAPEREHLAVAGSGAIAVGLAVCCVHERGGHVLLWARSDESAQRAVTDVTELCAKLDHPEAADRVRVTSEISDLAEATLVVEAVREDAAIKGEVLRAIREAVSPRRSSRPRPPPSTSSSWRGTRAIRPASSRCTSSTR